MQGYRPKGAWELVVVEGWPPMRPGGAWVGTVLSVVVDEAHGTGYAHVFGDGPGLGWLMPTPGACESYRVNFAYLRPLTP